MDQVDRDTVAAVWQAVGFTLDPVPAVSLPAGVAAWSLARDPQVAIATLDLRGPDRKVAVEPVPAELLTDGLVTPEPASVAFRPPADPADATAALLARTGLDALPTVPVDVAADRALAVLVRGPFAEHPELDRLDVELAVATGASPYDLLPGPVRALAGSRAAERVAAIGTMLHPHVALARAGMAAAGGPVDAVGPAGVDTARLVGSHPEIADACVWLGRHALVALTAAGVAAG